ncbi:MAG: type I polyketide synthase, partial [Planctomycetota bacterium]
MKSNIGHLDAAAGIAGLIKTAMALQRRQMPASLNYERPNPQLELDRRPFVVNAKQTSWREEAGPLRAGVSSFGMGGTNAHVVLEEPPVRDSVAGAADEPDWQIAPLSARTPSALAEKRRQLADWLRRRVEESPAGCSLADVAFTLQVGRRAMPCRDAFACRTVDETVALLAADCQHECVDTPPPVVFMFSGQGSQYAGMARDLFDHCPRFRELLETCWNETADGSGPPTDVIGARVTLEALLQQDLVATANAQPALFAIEYALARLLMSWGVEPTAMIGHSLGEYVAACIAGVFSLRDALQLVRRRGEAMQRCRSGSMLAVMCDEQKVRSILPNTLEFAVKNSPAQIVVSGPTTAIESFENSLRAHEIACRRLETSHAFHSAMMDDALEPFRAHLANVRMNPPSREVISNRTGTWLTAEQATSTDYWVDHLRRTVLFSDGLDTLANLPNAIFLEVGPGQALCNFAKSMSPAATLQSLSGMFDRSSDAECMARVVSEVWKRGVPVDWHEYHASMTPVDDREGSLADKDQGDAEGLRARRPRRVALPTYPFERQSYYVPLRTASDGSPPPRSFNGDGAPPSQSRVHRERTEAEDWFYVPSWRSSPIRSNRCDAHTIVFGDALQQEAVRACLGDVPITWVDRSDRWSVCSAGFHVELTSMDDYGRLWEALNLGESPIRLLHLWGVRGDDPLLAFDSLVALSQSLLKHRPGANDKLDVVTCGLFQITGQESASPKLGMLPGLLNVLEQESEGLTCSLIDLEMRRDAHATDPICQAAQRKPLNRALDPTDERVVAYRGRRRWIRSFESEPLPDADSTLLREGATYLIVGDFIDGLGMVYAKALREHLSARLVLIGPDRLPSVREWDSWLATHGNQHPTSRLIKALKGLGREGDDFLFSVADTRSAT